MQCEQLGIKTQNMSKKRLPVRMRRSKFAQMKDIPEVVLRAQQVTQTIAVRPGFEHTPIKQPIQKLLCTVEGHVKVIPTRRGQA